ncbi:MAG: isochorismatase family protein [Bacteroidia bacterium]|nr:isochorismatase family protein [Bacteroidia bacterium]MDW8333392.1 isochorismatase family protein [Bacteroidia bacterium]
MTSVLLLIDAQNDFCDPRGALCVPGAAEDMRRLSQRIRNGEFDAVVYTLDTHDRRAIFHPSWFEDEFGRFPAPFTTIRAEDVETRRWRPRYFPQQTLDYLRALKASHTIWPEHCIAGTWGHGLFPVVAEALQTVSYVRHVIKGVYPLSEHYGVFEAEVVSVPETRFNDALADELTSYDRVYFAGEARSHCVAASLRQWLTHRPEAASKTYVLTDCTSDVPGFNADEVYRQAAAMGVGLV